MTSFRIRPRFEVVLDQPKDTLIDSLRSKIENRPSTPPCDVIFVPGHVRFKIKKEEQHYWSPQLDLTFLEEDVGTVIKGRYGPHQNVWTLFALLYLATAILTLFVAIIGFSRWSLGLTAHILWVLPVLLGFAAFLYILSQVGQKLGAEETFTLHHFLEELLGRKIHIS